MAELDGLGGGRGMRIRALLRWIIGITPTNDTERRRRDEPLAAANAPPVPVPPHQPKPLPKGKQWFELEPDDFEFKETRAMVEILRKRRREAKPAWRGDDGAAEGKRRRTWREGKDRGVSRKPLYPGNNLGPSRHR
jgi:hypothetical protein